VFVRIVILVSIAAFGVAVVARQSTGAGPEHAYLVRPGDTLWSIAVGHYGGDPRQAVWNIQHRNHLTGTAIQPGQRITLPSG
jgi:LysM repeat protein